MQQSEHSRAKDVTWVVTNQTTPWVVRQGPAVEASTVIPDVMVRTDIPRQSIEGFGACFNELGWTSLAALNPQERDAIFHELFAPGVGANFTLCRMPIAANDIARKWYSYDETPDDFALEHFSISNDIETLIPFIKSGLKYQPELKIWASPWSPPTWMKYNKHYATALPAPWQQGVTNWLRPDQVGKEGTDMFIQEDRYFQAYASYFGRFVDEYRNQGINVRMVMPQNEFNSAQVFPSCTWTPEGLARFISYLGPEMEKRDVEIFLGTLERPNAEMVEVSLRNPKASKYIQGVALQWAGKGAIGDIRRVHPNLRLYQSEQECGFGENNWRYCRYTWSLMKHFFGNGVSAYLYWNLSMPKNQLSTWGWPQNSLVTVDTTTKTAIYNYEYYLMKHLSHFVMTGAKYLETVSYTGYANQLAFANPDGSIVVVMQNDLCEEMPVRLAIDNRMIAPTLPADSFNTFVIP